MVAFESSIAATIASASSIPASDSVASRRVPLDRQNSVRVDAFELRGVALDRDGDDRHPENAPSGRRARLRTGGSRIAGEIAMATTSNV